THTPKATGVYSFFGAEQFSFRTLLDVVIPIVFQSLGQVVDPICGKNCDRLLCLIGWVIVVNGKATLLREHFYGYFA
ncbi:hypothetical protein, partial [Asticcacaulis benevestitus]|uniref:hypothetical protein n=1 Tax=Asticcacaulis benevestitus TaxID=347481 RepID=UPI001B7FC15D